MQINHNLFSQAAPIDALTRRRQACRALRFAPIATSPS